MNLKETLVGSFLFLVAFGLILFILSVTTSCAHNPYIKSDMGQHARQCLLPVPVGIVEGTPEPLANAIRDAMKYWNSVDSRKYFISLGEVPWGASNPMTNGFVPVQVVPTDSLWNLGIGTCGNAQLIIKQASGCISRAKILIADRCTGPIEHFETIVRHELGHVLGLKDSVDFTSLMSHAVEPTMQHPVDANLQEKLALAAMYQ